MIGANQTPRICENCGEPVTGSLLWDRTASWCEECDSNGYEPELIKQLRDEDETAAKRAAADAVRYAENVKLRRDVPTGGEA